MSTSLKSNFWTMAGPFIVAVLIISFYHYTISNSLTSLSLDGILLTLALIVSLKLFRSQVLLPISNILHNAEAVSLGDMSQNIHVTSKNEIGSIGTMINKIVHNQVKLSEFATAIGEGKYESVYNLVSDKDILGLSLTNMRDRLHKVSAEDTKRSWTNVGLAKFSDILRSNNEDIRLLSEILIQNLIKYVSANQGGVFLLKENKETLKNELEMSACYAWNRKKFQEKIIQLGDGLVGQCALERDTIYMEEVPDEYVTISSGLGEGNPTSVLIIPVMVNDSLQGVLEIASFKKFQKHEIEFIEKVCESFASTLSSARTNEHTRYLLEASNKMTESMRIQEEELRQNTEELQAAQESLNARLAEAKSEMLLQIQKIEGEKKKNIAVLEGCVDGVITFNSEGKVEFFNRAAEDIWGFKKADVLGMPLANFISIDLQKIGNDYVASH